MDLHLTVIEKYQQTDRIIESGELLLTALQDANTAIHAPCGGKGTCGKCIVRIVSGQVDASSSRNSGINRKRAGSGGRAMSDFCSGMDRLLQNRWPLAESGQQKLRHNFPFTANRSLRRRQAPEKRHPRAGRDDPTPPSPRSVRL